MAGGKDAALLLAPEDDAEQLLSASVKPRVYAARWWVLFVYSMLAGLQGGIWAIPGPISGAYKTLYGVDDNTIQMLVNLGPFLYLALALPFAYFMDAKGGLRWSIRVSIALVVLGSVARCAAVDESTRSTVLLYVGYGLNAAAGPVAMAAVNAISEGWFAVNERATATAIMAEANSLGGAVAYLTVFVVNSDAPTFGQLQLLNQVVLWLTVFNLLVSVYFPSRPPTPPSISASLVDEHEAAFTLRSFWGTLKALSRSRNFIVLIFAYGMTTGMYGSWAATMTLNLQSLNIPGYDATWAASVGLAATLAGNIGGLVLGRVMDRIHRFKLLLVVLMTVATLSFTAFAVIAAPGVLPASLLAAGASSPGVLLLFITASLGGLALNSTIPAFFELAVEVTHPEPTSTVVMALTLQNNVGCAILLFVPANAGAFNWVFAGTCAVFTAALALGFTEKTLRLDVDTGKVPVEHAAPHDKLQDEDSVRAGLLIQ